MQATAVRNSFSFLSIKSLVRLLPSTIRNQQSTIINRDSTPRLTGQANATASGLVFTHFFRSYARQSVGFSLRITGTVQILLAMHHRLATVATKKHGIVTSQEWVMTRPEAVALACPVERVVESRLMIVDC